VTHIFHEDAEEEFVEAIQFYESLKVGLGARFNVEVRKAIRRALENPSRWYFVAKEVRVSPVHVFPYKVLFSLETEHILILAIMHNKRRPDYWRGRQQI
jgi:toxin ParE1/3/4